MKENKMRYTFNFKYTESGISCILLDHKEAKAIKQGKDSEQNPCFVLNQASSELYEEVIANRFCLTK
jgi:hypothetical protein